MNDYRASVPFGHKCALCGKRKGDHKAGTFHCPVGSRGRANTYSFSSTERFEPFTPRLPVALQKLISNFQLTIENKAFVEVKGDAHDNELANERYTAARYALYARLNEVFYQSKKFKL